MRYLVFIIALFAAVQTNAQNNIVYGAGINYTNGAPTFTPPVRTSHVAIDTVTGKWYHFNTPGGWQLIGNTIEEIAGCTAPAYTPGKGDSKVVINNCSPQPELYFWNGSAWVLVGGGSVYAGEGIRIENDTIILDSLYVLRFRTGDTTDLNAGAVSWNAGEQTLDVVINQGAVTGQMFQEVLYFTKNQTGTQIDDGTVVMAAGTTGNSGKILIAPAIADGSVNSEYILGLATQNLPNGGEGMVTHFGKVRGIQTDGANYGETWVDGDVLYCSAATPGYLTKVLPTAPNLKVPIAIVIHAHPSNGTLFVRPSHFPDLAQINDVQLSSPTNGQVLTYNSTLSRWENATPANQLQTLSTDNTPGNISISSGNTITLNVNDADASTTNELQTLSTGTNTLTLSNGGGTVTVDTDPADDVTGSGVSGQVSFWTGAQTQSGDNGLFWDNSLKDLGIGTNAPSSTLDVIGNVEFQNPTTAFDAATIGAELLTTGTGTNWTGTGYSTGYLHTAGSTDPLTSAFTPVAANYYVVVVTVSGRTTGSISFTFGNKTGTTISTNTTQTYYWVAGSIGKLIITPTTDFNGTVVASVKELSKSSSQYSGRISSGALVYEERLSLTNIMQGLNAGENNITGSNNIFQGSEAGRYNTTGINNVFQGLEAGKFTTTGSNNIFQNSYAGLNNTTGSNNVFQGTEAGRLNTTGSWNIFQGTNAGYSNTTGNYNIAQGLNAGYALTTSTDNIFQGQSSGRNTTSGSFNVFMGGFSGFTNSTGAHNIFIGYEAGRLNTTGGGNIFLGRQTGASTTTGLNNTFVGNQAGNKHTNSNFNSMFGGLAGFELISASNNTYVGYNAARENRRGGGNTIVGAGAGRYFGTSTSADTSINNSILIGFDTRAKNGNETNQIVIGYEGRGLGSNTTVLGNSSTTQTWLGGSLTLGTQVAPAARLHVVGSGTSSSTWTAQFHNASTGGNNALMIRDDGNVGIGTNSPAASLHVVGTATTLQTDIFRVVNGNNQNVFRVHGSGAFRFGNAANSAGPLIFPQSTLGSSEDLNGTNLTFFNYTTSQLAPLGKYLFTGEQSTQTTGDNYCFYIRERFSPPSGTATSTAFYVRSEINQTAGGTGITRGLSVVPSLQSAVQYQSIHWNTARGTNNWGLFGQGTAINYLESALAIGTTTPNASAAFEVSSTTQGVLFPRMTTTQRNAIATPADGLVIYNTTDNKLQVRAGGAWVDLH